MTTPHDIKPELLCKNNQLVIRWPTNSTFNGIMETLPADIDAILSNNIAAAGTDIFKMIVTTRMPP